MPSFTNSGNVILFSTITVVLNEKQRVAKRKLIEDNRERRRDEVVTQRVKTEPIEHPANQHIVAGGGGGGGDCMSNDDRRIINEIGNAYDQTAVKVTKTYTIVRTLNTVCIDTMSNALHIYIYTKIKKSSAIIRVKAKILKYQLTNMLKIQSITMQLWPHLDKLLDNPVNQTIIISTHN